MTFSKSILAIILISSAFLFFATQKTSLQQQEKVALNHQEGTPNLLVQKASYGQQPLYGGAFASLNYTDPNIQIPILNYVRLLNYFDQKGIEYEVVPEQNNYLAVTSLEKLEDITINLVTEDNTIYTATIKPSEYSFYNERYDEYQLLIVPTMYFVDTYSLGAAVFSGYKLDYDETTKTTYIQKKDKN
ncbi:hypothetical protein ABPG74_016110 [Tetrahymena malaccensis]